MSKEFKATDIALARRLRALESANDAAIRASADLITTMLDACDARNLPACAGHASLMQMGGIMTEALNLRGSSITAHEAVASLAASLGLKVKAWGDICQMSAAASPMRAIGQAA